MAQYASFFARNYRRVMIMGHYTAIHSWVGILGILVEREREREREREFYSQLHCRHTRRYNACSAFGGGRFERRVEQWEAQRRKISPDWLINYPLQANHPVYRLPALQWNVLIKIQNVLACTEESKTVSK